MKTLILIVEPDPVRGKQLSDILYRAGYVALVAPDAARALRRLFQTRPAVVLLSDRLSVAEVLHLCDRIAVMADLPVIALTETGSLAEAVQQLTCSIKLSALIETLNGLLT